MNALDVFCVQLTRDLFAIAKFFFILKICQIAFAAESPPGTPAGGVLLLRPLAGF